MIFQNISLSPTAERTKALLEAYTPLQQHLERRMALKLTQLETLRQQLSAAVAENPDLCDLLKKRNEGGDHYSLQLHYDEQAILNLPWGLAKDPVSGAQLGQLPRLYLSQGRKPMQEEAYQPTNPGPLKVLVMISSPVNSDFRRRLSFEDEERVILQALDAVLEGQGVEVDIDFTDDGSLEALKRKLEGEKYHVLHFSGHGSFRDGKGHLELEDPLSMRAISTPAADFAEVLACRTDGYRVPLVVLAACQTAQGVADSDTSGVAEAVLSKDIPAVVAMSLSVDDSHASLFAAKLYQGLVAQRPLPQAFQKAVQQVSFEEGEKGYTPLQWLIPRLYLQQPISGLLDTNQPVQPLSRKPGQYFSDLRLQEKLSHPISGQAENPYLFIGRREDKRELLPQLFAPKPQPILLRGQGGLGKTALAAQLAYRWRLRHGEVPVFFFNETNSQVLTIYDKLKNALPFEILIDLEEKLEKVEKLGDEEKKRQYRNKLLFEGLNKAGTKYLLIFDNLESFQAELGGGFAEEHQELEAFLAELIKGATFPIICTGRYPLPDLGKLYEHSLRQASFNDYWKKAQQLAFFALRSRMHQLNRTSTTALPLFKDLVRLLYDTLGGNYRALEWFDALYQSEPEAIEKTLKNLESLKPKIQTALLGRGAPQVHPDAPTKSKQEENPYDLGRNLIFEKLLRSLGPEAKQTLSLLRHFTLPVRAYALQAQGAPSGLTDLLDQLEQLTLAERYADPDRMGDTWYLPPLTRQLLAAYGSDLPEVPFDYERAGDYHWHVQSDLYANLPDLQAAFEAYQAAEVGEKMSRAGVRLTIFFSQHQSYNQAFYFGLAAYQEKKSITNSLYFYEFGYAASRIGKYAYAREAYLICINEVSLIVDDVIIIQALNGISQIEHIQGDSTQALQYLERALQKAKEIGNKKGEATTLSNLSRLYIDLGYYKKAIPIIQASLKFAEVTNDFESTGECHKTIARIAIFQDRYQLAIKHLLMSLDMYPSGAYLDHEIYTLNEIASVYRAKGNLEKATEYLQNALSIVEKQPGDYLNKISILLNWGSLNQDSGEIEVALKKFEQAYSLAVQIDNKTSQAICLNNIGDLYKDQYNYNLALQYFQNALTLLSADKDKKTESTIVANIVDILITQGLHQEASQKLTELLAIHRKNRNKLGEGKNLLLISKLRISDKDALSHAKSALDIFRKIGVQRLVSKSLDRIGEIYLKMGSIELALNALNEALIIKKDSNDKRGEGFTLNKIALVHRYAGNYSEGLKMLEAAYSIHLAISDFNGASLTQSNISYIYRKSGDYKRALQHLKYALELQERCTNVGLKASILSDIGEIYEKTGNYEKGLEYFRSSLKIHKDLGNKFGEGATLNDMGELYRKQGLWKHAHTHLENALQIRRQILDKDGEATTLNNLGLLYDNLCNPGQAIGYLTEALEIRREQNHKSGEGTVLGNLGLAYLRTGAANYEKGHSYLQMALAIMNELGDTPATISIYNNLATLSYRRGDMVGFYDYSDKAWKLAEEINEAIGLYYLGINIGDALYHDKYYDRAIIYYQKSYKIASENNLPRQDYLKNKILELGSR